jgi:hypothetical protein
MFLPNKQLRCSDVFGGKMNKKKAVWLGAAFFTIIGFQNCGQIQPGMKTEAMGVDGALTSPGGDIDVGTDVPATPVVNPDGPTIPNSDSVPPAAEAPSAGDDYATPASGEEVSQKLAVESSSAVDVLFVVDNSGSMRYEQKSMASRVSNFLTVLKGLDYQIAVTTTDPRASVSWGDGQLVPFDGGTNSKFILNSSMDAAQSQDMLSKTLQRTEKGDGTEQAIYASTRVVERALEDSNSVYGRFIRPAARLAIVVISDEDESRNGKKNSGQNLINLVKQGYGEGKSVVFHSIITRPGDLACKNGEGATYGEVYKAFSDLTGGVLGDVCAKDYADQVKGIAEGVKATLNTVTLTCTPMIDSSHHIKVYKNGVLYSKASSLMGVNLVFNEKLEVGDYELRYTCLK